MFKLYAGFVVGNLVQIEVEPSHATNLNIQLIVAERNFSKEARKTKNAKEILIGAPRVKQVHCSMPRKYAEQVKENQNYRIVRVSRVPSMSSYENLLAITSVQPGYTEWLTAVSGIPLHPEYVAERDRMKSSTISSFDKFRILLHEAKYIRSFCKNKEGEWLDAAEAKEKISKYILYYCSNNANHANYIAEILQQTLACQTEQLWDMLLALTGVLKCGMQIFHIQGPVGAGKGTAIRAFCLFYSLRFTGSILIFSTQNASCNAFTEDMWDA